MALIGPFKQIVTMRNLPEKGCISDAALEIIPDGGVLFKDGIIEAVGSYKELYKEELDLIKIHFDAVLFPGWIDAHTHICFGGSRASDYAARVSGLSYQEIAAKGGGILDTVAQTRKASEHELEDLLEKKTWRLAELGITTCEVKSGYGLTLSDELKMLEAIQNVNREVRVDLIPTCLAAHVRPPEFQDNKEYLQFILDNLLPQIKNRNLAHRVDIFIEKNAFTPEEGRYYLEAAKRQGFSAIVHADQFSTGGSRLAAEIKAISADHLEQTGQEEARLLAQAGVVPVVLPGATLGLGMPFPPARMLLDEGLPLVIASDWNPGSAPMGNLIMQAAVLGAAQKISTAETLAAITIRAARALGLNDRGMIDTGLNADFAIYPVSDYREILYNQGSLYPAKVYAKGRCIHEF